MGFPDCLVTDRAKAGRQSAAVGAGEVLSVGGAQRGVDLVEGAADGRAERLHDGDHSDQDQREHHRVFHRRGAIVAGQELRDLGQVGLHVMILKLCWRDFDEPVAAFATTDTRRACLRRRGTGGSGREQQMPVCLVPVSAEHDNPMSRSSMHLVMSHSCDAKVDVWSILWPHPGTPERLAAPRSAAHSRLFS